MSRVNCKVCGFSQHDSDLFKTPDINDICERCFRKHYSLLSKIDKAK